MRQYVRGAGHEVYLDLARIFLLLRFNLRIRFLRHLALIVGLTTNLYKQNKNETLRDNRSTPNTCEGQHAAGNDLRGKQIIEKI